MLIAVDEPDVILLTEVIPKAQVHPISPALLSMSGYSLYSNFEPHQTNLGASGTRGICIYVKSTLSAALVSFSSCSFKEQLWVKLELMNADTLLIGCIYRSPSGDSLHSVDELCSLLRHVCATNPSHLLIAGDFNVPDIDWEDKFSPAPENHCSHHLIQAINDCFLVQHVTQPTRYRQGESSNILDLILTNEEGMIDHLCFLPGLGSSDHVTIRLVLTVYSSPSEPEVPRHNFRRADFASLNAKLQEVDWETMQELELQESYL